MINKIKNWAEGCDGVDRLESAEGLSDWALERRGFASRIKLAMTLAISLLAANCGARTGLLVYEGMPMDDSGAVEVAKIGEDAGLSDTIDADILETAMEAGADGASDGEVPVNCDKINMSFVGPSTMTVPVGATHVPIFCYRLGNGCESLIKLRDVSMIFTRFGAGPIGDIAKIRLNNFGVNEKIDPVTQKVMFKNGAYDLAPNQWTYTQCVEVDISPNATAGSNHGLMIEKATDIFTAAATINVPAVPMKGNIQVISGTALSNVAISKSSEVLENILSGTSGKIAAFTVTSPASEEGNFSNILLNIDGATIGGLPTESRCLSDVELRDGTTIIPLQLKDNFLKIDKVLLTPQTSYKIASGSSKTFQVYAKNACPVFQKIKTCLSENDDLIVRGSTFGFGLPVTNNFDCLNNASEVEIK